MRPENNQRIYRMYLSEYNVKKHVSCISLFLSFMFCSSLPVHAQRTIAFDGIENARDMGGLIMQDGQTVRSGMLIALLRPATAMWPC